MISLYYSKHFSACSIIFLSKFHADCSIILIRRILSSFHRICVVTKNCSFTVHSIHFKLKSLCPKPRTGDVHSKAVILISLLGPVLLCLKAHNMLLPRSTDSELNKAYAAALTQDSMHAYNKQTYVA